MNSASLVAGINGDNRWPIKAVDLGDNTGALLVMTGGFAVPSVLYRTTIASADVLDIVSLTSFGDSGAAGSLANATYNLYVVGGNKYGRTPPTEILNWATGGASKAALITVDGYDDSTEWYDIFMSVDADPKWVGRVTEAQMLAGAKITAVGTVTSPASGVAAQTIQVNVAGTGSQLGSSAVENTAYRLLGEPVNCAGFQVVDFDIAVESQNGALSATSIIVMPFFYDDEADDLGWYAGASQELTVGGPAGTYTPWRQRFRVECRGNAKVHLVVVKMAGYIASIRASCS